jgi:hypothetical protein
MAKFTGWTIQEIRTAFDKANAHFQGNLCIRDLTWDKTMKRSGEHRCSCTLTALSARRLRISELRANYPETLKKYYEAKELLPDFLYPAGCTVRYGWRNEKPKGVAWGCWHAHGQFYRELFKINPKGHIMTSIAIYNTEEGFNCEFPRTGDMTNGTVCLADSCSCNEHDIGMEWQ